MQPKSNWKDETMKKYNVWVSIEVADEDSDTYEDYDLPEKLGEFETADEAVVFVAALSNADQLYR